ncbi:MAG: AAA family ATPase [Gammaproteobacteria bacterium]|nr:AAA family ATPase [Gammaproteobacteria bacterium]
MPDFINSLKRSLCHLHGVSHVQVIETHISWVLLTGKIVYKVKKPVDLGFVDFTTLEKRKFYCFEELRLNKRLAPELYIDVAAITRDTSGIAINGKGPAIEYAVRLHQFDRDQQLDVLIEQHQLTLEHVQDLAAIIANFHRNIKRAAPDTRYGEPAVIHQTTGDNYQHCRRFLTEQPDIQALDELETWNNAEFSRIAVQLVTRKKNGFVRECHGDLHLGNIAIFKNRIMPFDCIEFNPDFRWIDVISEVAFLVMDLFARGREDLAAHFLNDYLTLTGDYDGLSCLRFYLAYRAMVRAKVEIIRANQPDCNLAQRQKGLANYHHFIKMADKFRHIGKPLLMLTHGLSGSGKTTIVRQLFQYGFAIHLRSDVERKRLFNLQPSDKSDSAVDRGIYTREASEKTYAKLFALTDHILRNNWNVIVDATFLQQAQRNRFRQLAAEHNVKFVILDCRADEKILKQRITTRALQATEVSEATLQVLERQLETAQPFTDDEQQYVVPVNTGQAIDIKDLARELALLQPKSV